MKRTILLLMVAGLIAGVAVGCGGTGVSSAINPGGTVDVPDNTCICNTCDCVTGNDEAGDSIIDDGSDIIFDDINIVLPGEGDDFFFDATRVNYGSITGFVVEVSTDTEGRTHVFIEDRDGNLSALVLNEDTVFPFSNTVEIDDIVTGWFLLDMPTARIYPPQYTIAVLIAGAPEYVSVKVDRFSRWDESDEGYMMSPDNTFAFKVDENTVIVSQDGSEFDGFDIDVSRRMVVIYEISTSSIPEFTVAQKVIVLFESFMALG